MTAAPPTPCPPAAARTVRHVHAPANRLPAALLACGCAAPLLIGAWLTPDPSGVGTHTQLGMLPCGFKVGTGLPCATCGMTTAFSHAANGDLLSAFVTQPAGAALALLCAVVVIICGYAAIAGADLSPVGRALWRPRTILLAGGLFLAGWAYTLGVTISSM